MNHELKDPRSTTFLTGLDAQSRWHRGAFPGSSAGLWAPRPFWIRADYAGKRCHFCSRLEVFLNVPTHWVLQKVGFELPAPSALASTVLRFPEEVDRQAWNMQFSRRHQPLSHAASFSCSGNVREKNTRLLPGPSVSANRLWCPSMPTPCGKLENHVAQEKSGPELEAACVSWQALGGGFV